MSELPDRFPRGWFVLGHQRDFETESTKTIHAFNRKLLVTRNSDNSISLDPGNGESWPTLEINQMVMCWHDVEGGEPDYEPEKIDACYSDEWSDYGMASFLVKNNCRELIDNMADKGHFGPVHQAPFEGFWNEAKDHTYTQEMTADSPILGRDLFSQARYEGPAYMTTYMSAVHDGAKVESRLLVSHIPLTLTSFVINFGVMVKKVPGMSAEDEAAFIQGYVDANNFAFGQDVAIWENKIYIPDPVVCDGDGPLHKLKIARTIFLIYVKDHRHHRLLDQGYKFYFPK
jgi:3-ketosteroid 9alpha-monooxygenase subunit A